MLRCTAPFMTEFCADATDRREGLEKNCQQATFLASVLLTGPPYPILENMMPFTHEDLAELGLVEELLGPEFRWASPARVEVHSGDVAVATPLVGMLGTLRCPELREVGFRAETTQDGWCISAVGGEDFDVIRPGARTTETSWTVHAADPSVALVGSDGVGLIVRGDGDDIVARPLDVAPLAGSSPPVVEVDWSRFPLEGQPAWLAAEVQAFRSVGDLWSAAVSMGLLARCRVVADVSAVTGQILSGGSWPPEAAWARGLDPAERLEIVESGFAAVASFQCDLESIGETIVPQAAWWRGLMVGLCLSRDDLECAAYITGVAGEYALQVRLRELDADIRGRVDSLPAVQDVLDSERLLAVSVASPDAWWTAAHARDRWPLP